MLLDAGPRALLDAGFELGLCIAVMLRCGFCASCFDTSVMLDMGFEPCVLALNGVEMQVLSYASWNCSDAETRASSSASYIVANDFN